MQTTIGVAVLMSIMKGIGSDYTLVTQCGCFVKGRSEASIVPVALKDCDLFFSFVCCAAVRFSPGQKVKHLCCLDKKSVQAPPFLDRCRLTDGQFDNIESIFGRNSVAHHRQRHTTNASFVGADEQLAHMYRSNMVFGTMTLVAFLCLITLCFCSKFCQKNIIRRFNEANETAGHEIMECYLLQNLNSQSILRDFNPYSPYAFAPPSYETLPKEPPRYSGIYALENETGIGETGTATIPSPPPPSTTTMTAVGQISSASNREVQTPVSLDGGQKPVAQERDIRLMQHQLLQHQHQQQQQLNSGAIEAFSGGLGSSAAVGDPSQAKEGGMKT